MRFSNCSFGDEARAACLPSLATRPVALRTGPWSARSAGPEGVTAAGAPWALMEHEVVGKKAIIDRQPQHPGDVPQTWANVSRAKEFFGYEPTTTFKNGVEKFYEWWKDKTVV